VPNCRADCRIIGQCEMGLRLQASGSEGTGMPAFAIRRHDVEEFVGVVRHYGVDPAGCGARALVDAAKKAPEIAPVRIAQACGTCHLKQL
jgi:hypothetical protein